MNPTPSQLTAAGQFKAAHAGLRECHKAAFESAVPATTAFNNADVVRDKLLMPAQIYTETFLIAFALHAHGKIDSSVLMAVKDEVEAELKNLGYRFDWNEINTAAAEAVQKLKPKSNPEESCGDYEPPGAHAA